MDMHRLCYEGVVKEGRKQRRDRGIREELKDERENGSEERKGG